MDFTRQPSMQQPPPKNWLVESILVTIFCCLPLGIVGIVFAVQVNKLYGDGDTEGALQASANAGKWTKIGFWAGIIGVFIWVAFIFLFGGLAMMNNYRGHY